METIQERILDEAIKFELSMNKLYSLFQNQFKEDSEFWGKLADEEKNHAQIILKFRPFLSLDKEISNDFTSTGLSNIIKSNVLVNKIIDEFTSDTTREDAFRISIKLENNSSEESYRVLLNSEKNSEILSVFKILHGEDLKHYDRIINYIIEKNIKI